MMINVKRSMPSLLAACVAAVALGACGGGGAATAGGGHSDTIAAEFGEHPGSHAGQDTVAKVGALTISKPYLSLWMGIELGEDYYSTFKRKALDGLVSEPPKYPTCVATVSRFADSSGAGRPAPRTSAAQLRSKCEQLHQAVKAQALTFLIGADWIYNLATQHGIEASEKEAAQELARVRRERHETPAQFEASLLVRGRDRGQELYLAKIHLLQLKLERRIQSEGKNSKLAKEASGSTTVATCRTGYVVPRCKQFNGRGYSGGSPSALLREVAR
jgi:hypothetical protein